VRWLLGGEGGCNRKRDHTEDLKMCLSMDREEEARGEGQGGCGRAAFRASPSSGLLGVLIMAKLDHHITVQCPAAKACLRDLRLQFSLWLGGRTVTARESVPGPCQCARVTSPLPLQSPRLQHRRPTHAHPRRLVGLPVGERLSTSFSPFARSITPNDLRS